MLDGPTQIVATFFAALHEGKIDEGYATLTKDSKIAEKPEELKTLKAKTREAIEVFGNISGHDYVESRSVGQRLVRATYISQGKVFPLRWRFYFYKPENSWRLIDMRVDDKPDQHLRRGRRDQDGVIRSRQEAVSRIASRRGWSAAQPAIGHSN